jgi:hypothetical protein
MPILRRIGQSDSAIVSESNADVVILQNTPVLIGRHPKCDLVISLRLIIDQTGSAEPTTPGGAVGRDLSAALQHCGRHRWIRVVVNLPWQ